ncbi:MAG: hypothetical protein PUB77_01540 [Clostridiales bacterium]|nr:hypothetical protein [Clostridiales bacterium]
MTYLSDAKLKNKFYGFDIITSLSFLAALVFLLWKASYGIVSLDESFYSTVLYRLWQGDGMIVHEWHPGQLFSFLLLPIFSLFMAISGSTEGVFLFLRLLFVAAQFTGAVYIYIRLRHFQPLGAVLGSLALMLYAPLQMMALSYNTLAILMLSAACVTMLTGQRVNISAPVSGLLFAGAVLCCPYLVLVYIVYSVAVFVPFIRQKLDMPAFAVGYWLRFTAGCAVLALAFLAFLFSRCGLDEFFAAIPQVLNDPEHTPQSFGTIVYKYIESIYGNFYSYTTTQVIIFSFVIPLLALIVAIDRKRVEHRLFYIIPAMVITAAFFVYYIFNDRTVNFLMFPLNILGFFSCFLMRKRDMRPFVLLFLPGIMYSFCIHLCSNLGLMSIGSAMTVSGLASAIYVVGLFRELQEEKSLFSRLVGLGLLAALLLQLGVLTYFRYRYSTWDKDTSQLSVTIDRGPQKGLVTTPANATKLLQTYGRNLSCKGA